MVEFVVVPARVVVLTPMAALCYVGRLIRRRPRGDDAGGVGSLVTEKDRDGPAARRELGQVLAAAVGKKGTQCWMRRGCWAGQCGSVMRLPTPRDSVRRADTGLLAAARLQTGQAKGGKAGTGGQDARHVVVRWRGRTDRKRSRLEGKQTLPATAARHDDACVHGLWGASSGPLAGVSCRLASAVKC